MRALIEEIEREAYKYNDYKVVSVFVGGGTPTSVEPDLLCEVIQTLKHNFSFAEDAEISMEANPGTVSLESLSKYREAGINRLSIGLQSANDTELKLLGRIHTYAEFENTYHMARKVGFDNINVDLMSALPGQTVEDYRTSLEKVLSLTPMPEHISAYSLIVEEGTLFYERYGAEKECLERTGMGQIELPSEEEEREMYMLTRTMLFEAGFKQYEISNYSRKGYECRHNKVYWERGNYVGFGLGAASMVENIRFQNISDLNVYLQTENKVEDENSLSVEEQMEETMFLGLRLRSGVSRKLFLERFGTEINEVYGDVIAKNVRDGLLLDGEYVALTESGLDVSNYVMAQFLL